MTGSVAIDVAIYRRGFHKMPTIQLAHQWVLGSQIGSGGFGRVLEGVGEDGALAAVKLIPQAPGSDRELLFEDLTAARHVVPVIDSGEWNGNWVLVMPRATKSLRAHLTERGTLPPEEAVSILTDIAMALADLRGSVIHRDIKPENVLLLAGHWCLSDFGIARYAEASTAADTHKWAWTPSYNPPERWRGDRATSASDIYSLGVMAFEMLTGRRPFPGPEFRTQHLTQNAPPLPGGPVLLRSLITECLLKAPEVRPTATKVLERLGAVFRRPSPAASGLQAANQAQAQRIAEQAAAQSAVRSASERRREIFTSATQVLRLVAERLGESIQEHAPSAVWERGPGIGFAARLGPAILRFSSVTESQANGWGLWAPKFEVIAHAEIEVEIPSDRYGYEGREHSLWFCDAHEAGEFHWYEMAFMLHPLYVGNRARQNPFALPPSEEAGKALKASMAEFQVAWPFTALEPGNDDEFLERWMTWFGEASQGQLGPPSRMPEREPGSWR